MLAAASAVAVAHVGGARTAVCQPLQKPLLGSYYRGDNRNWELIFNSNCTFQAKERGTEEGGGDYTLTSGDASGGTLVFSNDRGCRQPDFQDLPTPYGYVVQKGVLKLTATSGDLCSNSAGTEGRAHDLGNHGGWIKSIAGRVKLVIRGKKTGSFKVTGAFADVGRFKVVRSRSGRTATRATLRLTGARGTFTVSERITVKGKVTWDVVGKGKGGYLRLTGTGTGTVLGPRQTLRGDVSN